MRNVTEFLNSASVGGDGSEEGGFGFGWEVFISVWELEEWFWVHKTIVRDWAGGTVFLIDSRSGGDCGGRFVPTEHSF